MQKFDPYHRWLGIPPHEQPPTLYRLLGLSNFESDREVITEASYRQIGHVKQYSSGQHRDAANQILTELAKAQVILLNPQKKAQYDISIQEAGDEEDELPSVSPPMISQQGAESLEGLGSSAAISRRPQKKSNGPLLIVLAVLSLASLIAGFLFIRQSQKAPPVVNSNGTTLTDPADTKTKNGGTGQPKATETTSKTPAAKQPAQTVKSPKAKTPLVEPI